MAAIVPVIVAENDQDYRNQVAICNVFSKRAHVVVSDGTLTEFRTLPFQSVWRPQGWEFDLHMMVSQPSIYVDAIIKLNPSVVFFHAEVNEDLTPTIQKLKQVDIKVGVVLQKSTYPGIYAKALAIADHVLIFSGDLDQREGEADLLQIEKIPLIRTIKHSLTIGWYGGASFANVRALAHAGIDVINVGQAIRRAPDQTAAYNQLVEEADRKGVRL